MTGPICLVEAQNTLGEGPCWHAATDCLYWFDIKQSRLFRLQPATGERRDWTLPVRASAAAPRADGTLLLATERGLARFDPADGQVHIEEPQGLGPGFRTNDGGVDPSGRFWWSSMDDDGGKRPGAIFRREPDGTSRLMIADVAIANTIKVSPDGRRLYWADSARQAMYVQALDNGELGERQVFASLEGEAGAPDGSAIDAEGCLWNCQWGAWRIVRYRPDGAIDRMVDMTVEQPSSCAFGGPDLKTLYITSAREGLDAATLAGQPLAGGLFALEVEVAGAPLPFLAD